MRVPGSRVEFMDQTITYTQMLNVTLFRLCIFKYQIILSIKQSRDHMTNDNLYHLTGQKPLREIILNYQLQFNLGMPTDEHYNHFVIHDPRSGHLFDQAHPGRNISIKVRPLFYLARIRSKRMKQNKKQSIRQRRNSQRS